MRIGGNFKVDSDQAIRQAVELCKSSDGMFLELLVSLLRFDQVIALQSPSLLLARTASGSLRRTTVPISSECIVDSLAIITFGLLTYGVQCVLLICNRLPKNTDKLLEAILDVNPNAIIVNQSGMPVEMPWVKKASTLLQVL